MCLQTIWADKEMEQWLKKQPEVIEICKYAFDSQSSWCTPANCHYCNNGQDKANTTIKIRGAKAEYWSGFHFFLNPNSNSKKLIDWFRENAGCVPLKCLIKKEWITAIGREIWDGKQYIVIVASQAIFPHYPEREARYEDLPKEEKVEAEEAVV